MNQTPPRPRHHQSPAPTPETNGHNPPQLPPLDTIAIPVMIGQIVPKHHVVEMPWTTPAYTTVKAVALVEAWLEGIYQETQVGIMLDANGNILNVYPIAQGKYNRMDMIAEDVFTLPRWAGVPTIVLAHNHSLGCVEPSDFDRTFTKDMVRASRHWQIAILDHLIIGQNRGQYFSFAERRFIRPKKFQGLSLRHLQGPGCSALLSLATLCTCW